MCSLNLRKRKEKLKSAKVLRSPLHRVLPCHAVSGLVLDRVLSHVLACLAPCVGPSVPCGRALWSPSCLSVHCGPRPVCPCIAVPVLSVRALRSPSCLSVHCGHRPVCPCIAVTVLSVRALRSPSCLSVHCGHHPVWPYIAVTALSVRALRSPSCLAVHCRALRSPSCGGPCVLSVTRFVAGPLGGVGLPPLVCDGIDDPAVCCCQDRVPVVSLFLSRSSSVYLVALVVG